MNSLAGELGPQLVLLYRVVHTTADTVLCEKVPGSYLNNHSWQISLINFGAHVTVTLNRTTGSMIIGQFELNDPNFLTEMVDFLRTVHPMSGHELTLLSQRNFTKV